MYSLLCERGKIIKKNFSERLEVAKLSILIARLPLDARISLKRAVKKGGLGEKVLIEGMSPRVSLKLVRILNRVGISAGFSEGHITPEKNGAEEIPFSFKGRNIWVSKEEYERLSRNSEKLERISGRMQLKTAESQIKNFEGEEEQNFMVLQKEYLELIKERDSIVDDFFSEEKFLFKAS